MTKYVTSSERGLSLHNRKGNQAACFDVEAVANRLQSCIKFSRSIFKQINSFSSKDILHSRTKNTLAPAANKNYRVSSEK